MGWVSLSDVYRHSGVVETFEQALQLGATVVLLDVAKSQRPAGSIYGDVVGFRILFTDERHEPLPTGTVEWNNVKHRFFRRGDSFLLYKTWSWPD